MCAKDNYMKLRRWYIEWDGSTLAYYFLTEFKEDKIAKGYVISVRVIGEVEPPAIIKNNELNSDIDLWGDEDIIEEVYEIVKAIFGEIEELEIL